LKKQKASFVSASSHAKKAQGPRQVVYQLNKRQIKYDLPRATFERNLSEGQAGIQIFFEPC